MTADDFFPDWLTLGEAKSKLRLLADDGVDCPLCTQRVKVYRRKLNHQSVRVLVALAAQSSDEWTHLPTLMARRLPDIAHQGGHAAIPAHWNLSVEEKTFRRDDGGRAGFWRITDKGRLWIDGAIKVPKYARTYNARTLTLVGEPYSVHDAWGTYFNLRDLLDGE